MTKKEKAEKRIRELSFALDMMNENIEFYENIFGGKEELEKWKNYQLRELKKAMNDLKDNL